MKLQRPLAVSALMIAVCLAISGIAHAEGPASKPANKARLQALAGKIDDESGFTAGVFGELSAYLAKVDANDARTKEVVEACDAFIAGDLKPKYFLLVIRPVISEPGSKVDSKVVATDPDKRNGDTNAGGTTPNDNLTSILAELAPQADSEVRESGLRPVSSDPADAKTAPTGDAHPITHPAVQGTMNDLRQTVLEDIRAASSNPGETRTKHEKAAEKGDSEAQYQMGLSYVKEEDGVPQIDAEGLEWLQRAAKKGGAKVHFALASLLLIDGMKNAAYGDESKSRELLLQAAESFARTGEEQSAVMASGFFSNKDLCNDGAKAVEVIRPFAEKGGKLAMTELGRLYTIPQWQKSQPDYAVAARWFRKSADADDRTAMYFLGRMYELGLGVEKSNTIARELMDRAAKEPHGLAEAKMWILAHD